MEKFNGDIHSQLAILNHKINERGVLLDETATAVKKMLNMVQSLVSRFDSGEGLQIHNCLATTHVQANKQMAVEPLLHVTITKIICFSFVPELIPEKDHQLGVLNQVHEAVQLNDTAADEIAGQKNKISITNDKSRRSKEDIKEMVQDAILHKAKIEDYKKKVKMKELGSIPSKLCLIPRQQHVHHLHARREFQRQELEACLRKEEELERGRKLFDAMPERNTISLFIMIGGYRKKKNDIFSARVLCDHMSIKDLVSWNSMIDRYCICQFSVMLDNGLSYAGNLLVGTDGIWSKRIKKLFCELLNLKDAVKQLSARFSIWRLATASNIPVLKEVEAIVDPSSFTAVRFAVSAIPFIPVVL